VQLAPLRVKQDASVSFSRSTQRLACHSQARNAMTVLCVNRKTVAPIQQIVATIAESFDSAPNHLCPHLHKETRNPIFLSASLPPLPHIREGLSGRLNPPTRFIYCLYCVCLSFLTAYSLSFPGTFVFFVLRKLAKPMTFFISASSSSSSSASSCIDVESAAVSGFASRAFVAADDDVLVAVVVVGARDEAGAPDRGGGRRSFESRGGRSWSRE